MQDRADPQKIKIVGLQEENEWLRQEVTKLTRALLELKPAIKPCRHVWIEGRNGLPKVFFNMANAYTQCSLCGKKQRT